MKKRITWCLAAGGTAGLALVMAAALLLVTMSAGKTSTASAQTGCELVVTKTANEDVVAPGGTIVWTITVANTGDETCGLVAVEDTLDSATHCDSWSPTAEAVTGCLGASGETVTWHIGDLPANFATQTLHLTVGVSAADAGGDTITNSIGAEDVVTTTADPSKDVTAASDSVTVEEPVCDLSITKDADNSAVAPGDDITYTITVTNEGDTDCADLIIEDDLTDTDLECVDASINDDDDLHFDEDALANSCDDNDVVWQLEDAHSADVLPAGDSVELELVVATSEDLTDGDRVTNEACVNGVNAELETAVVDDANAVCSKRTTRIVEPTATPTATATATPTRTPSPAFTPFCPPCSGPTSGPLPAVAPPATGTGGNSGGTSWTALGLGLGAISLMIGFSAMLARKRIRIRR